MHLKEFIELNGYTIYGFSKKFKIPNTTILDLCSGKTKIEKAQLITIKNIADNLNVSMEFIYRLDFKENDYLECNLPKYLEDSILDYCKNINTLHFDIFYLQLQSDINCAEVDEQISFKQASYLREKYL